jgi:hypothetical protein
LVVEYWLKSSRCRKPGRSKSSPQNVSEFFH